MNGHFTIEGRLPSLNEYTRAERGNRYAGNTMKQKYQALIGQYIRVAKLKRFENGAILRVIWYEQNEKRDIDNITFGKKYILDALVNEGILPDDSRKYIHQCEDLVYTDKEHPRIEVYLEGL